MQTVKAGAGFAVPRKCLERNPATIICKVTWRPRPPIQTPSPKPRWSPPAGFSVGPPGLPSYRGLPPRSPPPPSGSGKLRAILTTKIRWILPGNERRGSETMAASHALSAASPYLEIVKISRLQNVAIAPLPESHRSGSLKTITIWPGS